MKDTPTGEEGFVPDNTSGTVFIRIAVPELKVQKCLQFQLEHSVWQAKSRVLTAFAKDLRDPINYGMYLPPSNGRAGKFMEEERLLSEYPIQGPIGFLEFKYKRRVYKMMQINERKLKQMHTKTKLKYFLELVRAGQSEKINKMTMKGLDPNFHDQDNGETPLTIAVTLGKSKCREVIITLVSGGAHLDFRNRQGLTALHRAAIVGNAEAIRTMLDLGASPDLKDSRDLTPLYYSVSNDDTLQDCTLMLLQERARVDICDEHGWYEIHQACKYGRVQHLEHLLFYGAEMDVRNSCGNTPLHVCGLNNQEACARVLLFRGADPTLLNYNNQTADQVAAVAGNTAIADMIQAHNPDDVVPFREIPQYSSRRKGASLTPSLRALIRSRSDPRINFAGLDDMRSRSAASSPYGGQSRRQNGGYGTVDSDSACSVSVSSTGSVTGVTDQGMYEGRTVTGKEGYFPGGHLSQVNIRRAGSMGDVNIITRAANQRNTLATLSHVDREQHPRVVLLHRSSEGYGFVLRGAKSKIPTGGGFNDFTPTAEYPALQYLDSVDPGSQADRAGLKGGDFILEINGENVVRASHEHVVHLIRSSSDVLTLKVLTVSHTDRSPADWFSHPDSGAMTLPARRRHEAPLPPQRDPRTSLSFSKASSKSMTEGLAEIEKLDAAIAEFEGQEAVRRHSLHGLHVVADDPKVASVRASHTVKRVSVVDYDGILSGEPNAATAKDGRSKDYMSPAEARIKKYHKKSASQTLERSRSTPDIVSAVDQQMASGRGYGVSGIQTGNGLGGRISGTWTKSQAPPSPPQADIYSGALRASPTNESAHMMASMAVGGGLYQRRGDSAPGTPLLPDRIPVHHRTAPGAPPTPEVVRINTGGKNAIYANVSSDIQNRKKMESSFESSFRPGANAKLIDSSKGMALAPAPEQTILKHKRNASYTPADKNISFADERVMEHAQQFIQKYPNATLLVTADIHSDSPEVARKKKDDNEIMYEPEPDYDDSDDDKQKFHTVSNSAAVSVINSSPAAISMQTTAGNSTSIVRQSKSVTVISITSDSNKGSNMHTSAPDSTQSSPRSATSVKSSPVSSHGVHNGTTLISPSQSMGSSRRSSGVVMATPSEPSSAESSRRSSIDSNLSGDIGTRTRMVSSSSTSAISLSRSDNSPPVTKFPANPAPPPPPPLPPAAPPAPPIFGMMSMSSSPVSSPHNSIALRRQSNLVTNSGNDAATVLPSRVSTQDIMEAVAERKARLQSEGIRMAEVKPIPANKSSHELNQEALKAAVAKRKSRLEQGETKSVVNEIEARLQRNKKLQAAKFYGGDANRAQGDSKKDEGSPAAASAVAAITTPVEATPSPASAPAPVPAEKPVDVDTLTPKEIAARFEPSKALTQVKLSPVVPDKAPKPEPSENSGTIDFRAHLKPVDVRGTTAPVAIQSKASTPTGKTEPATSAPSPKSLGNISTIVMTKASSNKSRAPAPPASVSSPSTSSAVPTSAKTTTQSPAPPAAAHKQTTVTGNKTETPAVSKAAAPNPPAPAPTATGAPATSAPASSSSDYIALAEKARQEYLKKKAAGNLTPHVEKKGPVEITPNRKSITRDKPTSPTSTTPAPATKSDGPTLIQVKPAQSKGEKVEVTVGDKVKAFQSGGNLSNGKTNVRGMTEQSLSNGMVKKPTANGSTAPNMVPPPPPGFGDSDNRASSGRGVVIDIIPPPSSFSGGDSNPDSPANLSPYHQDDTASFVSSISSLSTLSSEHGEGQHHEKGHLSIEDMIAPPPPPPPDFGDSNLGDQDAFIPPPPEFLEIDSNANESKTMDKNSRPFATKAVSEWSCLDVLDWLDSLGLPQYRVSFARACVDGSRLVDMGRNEFINLGVTQVGHRMNLERSVKKLNLAASTNL